MPNHGGVREGVISTRENEKRNFGVDCCAFEVHAILQIHRSLSSKGVVRFRPDQIKQSVLHGKLHATTVLSSGQLGWFSIVRGLRLARSYPTPHQMLRVLIWSPSRYDFNPALVVTEHDADSCSRRCRTPNANYFLQM